MKKETTKKNGNKAKAIVNNTVKTLSPRQLAAQANNKVLGKPKGSVSASLVSLETLIKSLPVNAQVPISSRFLREMNITAEAPFISNTSNLKAIAAGYKIKVAPVVPVATETQNENQTEKVETTEVA